VREGFNGFEVRRRYRQVGEIGPREDVTSESLTRVIKIIHHFEPNTVSLNKLSKDIRDSLRRVLLNSITQERTPFGDRFRIAGLILDRVVETLRSAFLMSLIGCIVFRVRCVLLTMIQISSRRSHPHSRARMPHGVAPVHFAVAKTGTIEQSRSRRVLFQTAPKTPGRRRLRFCFSIDLFS
jgi:hypothetical protein